VALQVPRRRPEDLPAPRSQEGAAHNLGKLILCTGRLTDPVRRQILILPSSLQDQVRKRRVKLPVVYARITCWQRL
jgi:hypothetical protein